MFRALIADDEKMIRRGIAKLLEADDEIQVVAEAEDGEIALEQARRHRPELLLVDINMPFVNGLRFIEQLGESRRDAVIIVITGYDDFAYAQKALQLGVFDYMLKPVMEDSFYEMVGRAKEHLRQLQKKTKYLEWAREQLDKNHAFLVSGFLHQCLAGHYSDLEMQEQIEYLGIALPLPYGISFVHIVSDDLAADLREWDDHLVYYAAENIARELFEPLGPILCGRQGGSNLVLLSPCRPEERWRETGRRLCETLEEVLPAKARCYQRAGETLEQMADLYAAIGEEARESQRGTPVIAEARRLIEQNFGLPELSLQWVADRQNLSANYLCRLFRQENGMTFMDCVIQTRMRKATELLLKSDRKIYEIAEAVGYSSQHYFSNTFKKLLGVSPGDYRKTFAKG